MLPNITKPAIALVADTRESLNQLMAILSPLEFTLAGSYTHLDTSEWKNRTIHLWLVVSDNVDAFLDYLDDTDAPILMTENIPDRTETYVYRKWCQNLIEKVASLLQATPVVPEEEISQAFIEETTDPADAPTQTNHLIAKKEFKDIWVIVASLGGPEAVKSFFKHLTPDLPIAFIYGQHIDEHAAPNLVSVINNNSDYRGLYITDMHQLHQGQVAIYPPHQMTTINPQGMIQSFRDLPWDTPYTPNLNQIIDNVSEHFLYRMGVLVLSGMCDDGVLSATRIARLGAPVWTQNPDECISSSMPDAIITNEAATFIGNAENLAQKINQRYQ
ncbi:MAG: chemotaxis protein CheB [Cellvibrionales bacterium]|nr:chemotaxis protein CheB [Cellvibrionales bacterium]